ncbi:hypothetical protein GYMLUDRAFT_232052 [Collybiopsis luxurians FD-317 M1]|uniref:non-specific serine/threonine protein kinase n=1 Tax=Collybiopsis luxurians FD-317 M1 TaxID=944289 RepID=A0A0D0CHH6_9AGAR|nr:hypothetical protein GYMLUDRAFT_232052 [Collybiopsis luxurians FD-317 M1]
MPEVSLLTKLTETEQWWAARYEFLKEQGYMLRPRFRPGWKASFSGVLEAPEREDGQFHRNGRIMDALRISDSYMVALKRVKNPVTEGRRSISTEERISALFSNDEHGSDPRNHCVRLLQILHIPGIDDETILVLPWMRNPKNPEFRTIGEVLQFVKEIFEGVQYMHQNNVAHRDCSFNNMVMDANEMYPNGYHPCDPSRTYDWKGRARYFSRTQCPPRYYLIDFGFSEIYEPSKPRPLTYAIRSGGTEPPETQKPCDPFATDVFLLGTMVRLHILDGRPRFHDYGMLGFEFLRQLVNDMTQDDPSKRPSMDEVMLRFSSIVRSLSWYKLRSRAVKREETLFLRPFRGLSHLFWTCEMIIKRRTSIPISSSQ